MIPSYIYIIILFVIYYLTVLIFERKVIQDPKEIIEKFLSFALLYAGFSLIYFAFTGNPLPGDSAETYNIYIFVIGFIAVLWTLPQLLKEFSVFQKFGKKAKRPKQ